MRGQLAVALDGRTSTLRSGDRAHVPSGARHDWWHTGDEETQALVEVDPGDRFVEMLTSLWGLVRDGKTGGRPIPGPLQMAVTGRAYHDVMVAAEATGLGGSACSSPRSAPSGASSGVDPHIRNTRDRPW